MSISSEISRISGNVSAALTAIGNKGVTVPSGSNSDDLATLIGQITGGGGGTSWEEVESGNITIKSGSPDYFTISNYTTPFAANETYRITWGTGGAEYTCQTSAVGSPAIDGYCVGNKAIVGIGADTGEPFFLYRSSATQLVGGTTQATGQYYIKIERQTSGSSANLGTKTITANGTYDPEDDSLDGYSEVSVNVPDPADYTSASTAMGISKPMTSGIQALTTYANGITGKSDTTLSDAVYSLGSGYGSINLPWVSSVETVTIDSNSITNVSQVKTYFNSYTPYFAIVLKTAPTTNNQIVAMVNDAASALRYRSGSVSKAGVSTSYDAKLIEGTQYDIYHF